MEINIPEILVETIGIQNLEPFGVTEDSMTYKRYVTIELRNMSLDNVKNLLTLVEQHKEVRGAKVVIKDIETWLKATDNPSGVKVRRLHQFESLLIEYLLRTSGHRLYKKYDQDGKAWLCYYVTRIEYVPEQISSDYRHPEYVQMTYLYERFAQKYQGKIAFYNNDVVGKHVEEILANYGFYAETQEFRENYLNEIKKFKEIIPQIGKQYIVVGLATNEVPDDDDYHYSSAIQFKFEENAEKRNRVVVDVFREVEKKESNPHFEDGAWFWKMRRVEFVERTGEDPLDPTKDVKVVNKLKKKNYYGSDTETIVRKGIPPEDLELEPAVVEIPIHPFVVCFDLQRHIRISVHVNYLKPYVYDKNLSDKLILPDNIKQLIKMLIEHKEGGFKDIVAGKSGGVIVLLTGAPGVGKTLTAEVFAEAEEKPLYSVQASQLGTTPNELEGELMKVLQRAARWNAIMLIDEADVYVHQRGNDLQQNAIVGVFLRVLEYHASTLFLTTNRADLVDDAIASRCVARIDYQYPTSEEQKKIWNVLASTSGIALDQSVIDKFVANHPKMSGRDVKNLLKLAQLFSKVTQKQITVETLEYALKFKPTVIIGDEKK